MQIVDNSTKEIPFSDVPYGGVFKQNGLYYMAIIINDDDNFAVELKHGMAYKFSADEIVTPVNCELVIK